MAAPVFGEYGKVIVITQALTYAASAEDLNNVIAGGPLWVDVIRWYGASAGDDVIITDKNDKPITSLKATSNNWDQTVQFSEGARHWRGGFKVPTIDGGTLEIHLM